MSQFSVVEHKATRMPKILHSHISLPAAITLAGKEYDAQKANEGREAGICFVVMADNNASFFAATGRWPNSSLADTLYQCGVW